MNDFNHNTEIRNDDRMFQLIDEYGLEGYGFFWIIIEELAKSIRTDFRIKATHIWLKKLARSLQIKDDSKLPRYLDGFAKLGLIDSSQWIADGIIFSQDFIDCNSAQINLKRRQSQMRRYTCHRDSIYARDNHECVYCGSRERLSIDHVVPLTKGGTNDFSNLVTACISCNSSKGAKTVDEWRKTNE